MFCQTFEFINKKLGADAFSGKSENGVIRNEFILYYYDAIAVSLASKMPDIVNRVNNDDIINCLERLKYGDELKKHKTGSVNNVKSRIVLFSEGVQATLDRG